MFQLTDEEWEVLLFQFGTSKLDSLGNTSTDRHGGRRTNPYVFTEHGILMLANVLNSKRAINVSIDIIRAFNHLRQLVTENEDIRKRLDNHDRKINVILNTINQMLAPPKLPKKPVGFR